MDATELRIGNWVIEDGDYCQIYSVGLEKIQVTFSQSTHKDVSGENLQPIPLTPEILESCGFKKQSSGYRKLNNITLMYHSDNDCWLLKNYPFFDFKHLHQLQNLFFALKGKELEINLKAPAYNSQ